MKSSVFADRSVVRAVVHTGDGGVQLLAELREGRPDGALVEEGEAEVGLGSTTSGVGVGLGVGSTVSSAVPLGVTGGGVQALSARSAATATATRGRVRAISSSAP